MKITNRLTRRFWPKVNVHGPNECWPWTACTDSPGYGLIGGDAEDNWRLLRAHRVMWTLTYGPIPKGMCVLHHCDNRICCNPAHLFLGTVVDNNADMVSKGRQAKGENIAQSKITAKDVKEIRRRYATGHETVRGLASQYPIGRSQIHRIISCEKWKHV